MSINIESDQFLIMMCKACNVSLNQVEGFLLLQERMKEYNLDIDSIKRCEKLEMLFSDQGLKLNESFPFNKVNCTNEERHVVIQEEKDLRVWVTDRWQYTQYMSKKEYGPCKFKEKCERLDCKYIHYKKEYICDHKIDENNKCPDQKCIKIVLKQCLGGPNCRGKFCTYRHI